MGFFILPISPLSGLSEAEKNAYLNTPTSTEYGSIGYKVGNFDNKELWKKYVNNIYKPTGKFPIEKSDFLTMMEKFWGKPSSPYNNWSQSDKDFFANWYAEDIWSFSDPFYYYQKWFDGVNYGTESTLVSNSLLNPGIVLPKLNRRIAQSSQRYNDTVAKIVEIREDEGRDALRNKLSDYLSALAKIPISHTTPVFMLRYLPNNPINNFLMGKWSSYKLYIQEFQEKILVPYWNERTAREDREKLIKGAIILLAAAATALTAGLAGASLGGVIAGGLGGASSAVVKNELGISIDPKDLSKGFASAGDALANLKVPDIDLNLGNLINKAGDALNNINLDPGDAINNLKNQIGDIEFKPGDIMDQALKGLQGVSDSFINNQNNFVDTNSIPKLEAQQKTVEEKIPENTGIWALLAAGGVGLLLFL